MHVLLLCSTRRCALTVELVNTRSSGILPLPVHDFSFEDFSLHDLSDFVYVYLYAIRQLLKLSTGGRHNWISKDEVADHITVNALYLFVKSYPYFNP